MIQAVEDVETYRAQFERFAEGRESSWAQPLRRRSLERFLELGFPKTSDEDWRFTSLAPLLSTSFELASSSPAGQAGPEGMTREDVEPLQLRGWERTELVFVNGRYAPELSRLRDLPSGLRIGSLAEGLESQRPVVPLVEAHLHRLAGGQANAFAALNTAFVDDGALVIVPRGHVVERPIHVVFVAAPSGDRLVSHPRVLVVAGRNSQVQIVERFVSSGEKSRDVYFTNAVTEVVAEENAHVDHYKLQRESHHAFHIATLAFRLERNATLASHSISLGARLARNDIHALLDGEGGEVTLNGLYAVNGEQLVDHHTVIDHARPHCTSQELYKGILDGASRGVFNGRIIVRPDAQKTDARQTNKNLLLSKEALVNTNPQLEINADDVKCAHGATIGQLDEGALFYLRTRGIDRQTARALLTYGFLNDINERIRIEPLRSELERFLFARLPAGGREER